MTSHPADPQTSLDALLDADPTAATEPLSPPEPAAEASAPFASDAPLRARTRWAGIIWGVVLAAVAAAGLWLTTDDTRLEGITAWVQDLSPATAVGYSVLVVGALLLITGVVGLLRRAQRAIASRRP